MPSARAFPRHQRTDLAGEIPLREDIIRNVREALTALHVWRIKADPLCRGMMPRAVHVFVVHPNGSRNVRYKSSHSVSEMLSTQGSRRRTYDKTERGRGGASYAAREQLLNNVARLEPRGGAFLPPGDGAPLWVHEPLLEDVVEDILEVEQVGPVADVDELRGHRPLRARRLVVRDPELRTDAVCRNSHIVVVQAEC